MGEQVRVGDIDMYVDRQGRGDDVLLIGGLGDTTESWQFQLDGLADRYHLIAYDMRGAARSPDSGGPLSLEVVPTLVIAGGVDIMTPPRLGRVVAETIPGARFQLLPDEAHQPFQEIPEEFNRMVAEFWQEADARRASVSC